MRVPMALIKWVFPTPDGPYKNNGLNVRAGFFATVSPTVRENSLLFPLIKFSKL